MKVIDNLGSGQCSWIVNMSGIPANDGCRLKDLMICRTGFKQGIILYIVIPTIDGPFLLCIVCSQHGLVNFFVSSITRDSSNGFSSQEWR